MTRTASFVPRLAVPLLCCATLAQGCGGGGGTKPPAPQITPIVEQVAYAGIQFGLTPRIDNGVPATSFSISPPLPVGINFLTDTGFIAGTPLVPSAARTYTLTAHGADADGSIDFRLEVRPAQGKFACAAAPGANQLRVYSIDAAGQWTMQSSIATQAGPSQVLIHQTQRFLYSLNAGATTIASYTFDAATVSLKANGSAPPRTGTGPVQAVVHPNGRFLYVLNTFSADISHFIVGGENPLVPAGANFSHAQMQLPTAMVTDSAGTRLYVAHAGGIVVVKIAPDTGNLETLALWSQASYSVTRLLIDLKRRFLFALDTGNSMVRTLSLDGEGRINGAATSVTTGPFPNSMAFGRDRDTIYVAGFDKSLTALSLNAETGKLTEIGTAATMSNFATSLHVHPSGSFLFASSQAASSGLERFPVAGDGSLGAGTQLAGVAGPVSSTVPIRSAPAASPSTLTGPEPTRRRADATGPDRFTAPPHRTAVVHPAAGVTFTLAENGELRVLAPWAGALAVRYRIHVGAGKTGLSLSATGDELFVLDADGHVTRYSIDPQTGWVW